MSYLGCNRLLAGLRHRLAERSWARRTANWCGGRGQSSSRPPTGRSSSREAESRAGGAHHHARRQEELVQDQPDTLQDPHGQVSGVLGVSLRHHREQVDGPGIAPGAGQGADVPGYRAGDDRSPDRSGEITLINRRGWNSRLHGNRAPREELVRGVRSGRGAGSGGGQLQAYHRRRASADPYFENSIVTKTERGGSSPGTTPRCAIRMVRSSGP